MACWPSFSFYDDERGRETSHLDEHTNQAGYQEALQGLDPGPVGHPTFPVRLGESQQIDLRVLPICECRFVELVGIYAEAEVARRENENRSDDGEDGADDPRTYQDRVERLIGERKAIADCRPSKERRERARASENRRSSGTETCYDIPLFIERASGEVVGDFFKARRHRLDATRRNGRNTEPFKGSCVSAGDRAWPVARGANRLRING